MKKTTTAHEAICENALLGHQPWGVFLFQLTLSFLDPSRSPSRQPVDRAWSGITLLDTEPRGAPEASYPSIPIIVGRRGGVLHTGWMEVLAPVGGGNHCRLGLGLDRGDLRVLGLFHGLDRGRAPAVACATAVGLPGRLVGLGKRRGLARRLGSVGGAVVRISQWLVLRQKVPRAGWWVVASAVGWVAAAVSYRMGEAVGFDGFGDLVFCPASHK